MKKKVFLWLCWIVFCVSVTGGLIYLINDNLHPKVDSPVVDKKPIIKEEIKENKEEEEKFTLFADTMEAAKSWAATMTLEDKIGQLFFVRAPREEDLAKYMEYQPGGILMFAQDFDYLERETVVANIDNYQALSRVPLLIGVDEEGGSVIRVSRNQALVPSPFPSPQALYKSGGFDEVVSDAQIKSQYLKDLGINVNLAPVGDLASENDYIYPRTIGLDAKGTSEYVSLVVSAMREAQIGATLKHFPGYGNNPDTHENVVVDERTIEKYQTSDFLPFIAGIEAGVPSILVTHNIVTSMDNVPASTSKKVHEILRNDLGFEGVILTDDLYMGAIKEFFNQQDVCVMAFLAGNDMLVVTDFIDGYQAIHQAINEGKITEERLDESVERILAWKLQLGLLPGNSK